MKLYPPAYVGFALIAVSVAVQAASEHILAGAGAPRADAPEKALVDSNYRLLGVEELADPPPYPTDGTVPVAISLSKHIYPAEDGHLDAVVWLGESQSKALADSELRVAWLDSAGVARGERRIAPVPGRGTFLSQPILAGPAGGEATLRVTLLVRGEPRGEAERGFTVLPASGVSTSGRVALRVSNTPGATLAGLPVTVGVPFPRGALASDLNLRLVDENGTEIPLQTRVTGRWSRFGPIRWVLCDFAIDLAGGPRTAYLEFSPDINREVGSADWLENATGAFPALRGEMLRIDESGVGFVSSAASRPVSVFGRDALRGAFVRHENGVAYEMPENETWRLEEAGPEKAVLLREGWYRESGGAGRFCKYVTRHTFFRRSPLIRISHTWIFTGDAYEDRIAGMGWRLPLGEGFESLGFLDKFGADGKWLAGDYLAQRDFEEYELGSAAGRRGEEGRSTGIFAAAGPAVTVAVGVRDFHQNYPRELEFDGGAMVFHEWPRHTRAPAHADYAAEPHRLWFAHEGALLDLALPVEYTEEPIILEIAKSRQRSASYTFAGIRQRRCNAQGVAKTVEMSILFGESGSENTANLGKVLEGVEMETLRAAVDPAWVCASGVLHDMHPLDSERFAAFEEAYREQSFAPIRWAERIPVAGKWLWGVTPHRPDLHNRYQTQHRAFRKSHHGWPYTMIPYLRGGDPAFLKYAYSATRFQTDIAFCHYSDERVKDSSGERPRARGWYTRDRIPWAHNRPMPTSRAREDKVHYLWHSYHHLGDARAHDVLMDYNRLTRTEGVGETGSWNDRMALDYAGEGDNRVVSTMLRTYTEMYQETFDPWYMLAAQRIAERVVRVFGDGRNFDMGDLNYSHTIGGLAYNTGLSDYHRFTGDPAMRDLLLNIARKRYGQREDDTGRRMTWEILNATMLGYLSYAWRLSGEDEFAGRLRGWIEKAVAATYTGTPEYYRGFMVSASRGGLPLAPMFTGTFLQEFPLALAVVAEAGSEIESVPAAYYQSFGHPSQGATAGEWLHSSPVIAFRKKQGSAMPLILRLRSSFNSKKTEVEGLYRWTILSPEGDIMEGQWEAGEPIRIEVPAAASAGVYKLRVEGVAKSPEPPQIYLPLTPLGTPEVMLLADSAEGVPPFMPMGNFHFRVPVGMDRLKVVFNAPGYVPIKDTLAQFNVFDSAGELVWRRSLSQPDEPEVRSIEADVEIPASERGKIWSIALPHERPAPGGKPSFIMDDQVKQIFAISRDRWFDPAE